MSKVCPSCAGDALGFTGNQSSKVLIVASEPDEDAMRINKPFAGQFGYILRREMMKKAELDLYQCRFGYLWIHPASKNENCLKVGLDVIKQEAQGKTHIILIGALAVTTFTGLKVDKVSGLDVTDSVILGMEEYINPDTQKVFAMVTPNSIFAKGCGELFKACENMKGWLE